MTIRPVMATETQIDENDTPMIIAADQSNGMMSGEVAGVVPGNTIRSTGSKVSNLRAAFEQAGSNGTKRALSSDRKTSHAGNDRSIVDTELMRLREVMAKEQELRDAERIRLAALEEENEALKQRLQQTQEEDRAEELQDVSMDNGFGSSDIDKDLRLAKAQAERAEAEVLSLKTQLSEVKRSIATNTRIETHEMTDSAIQTELATLSYQIQDWTVNTFRKAKIEKSAEDIAAAIQDLGNEEQIILLQPLFPIQDTSKKLVVLQSVVISFMMPIFTDPMLFGVHEDADWTNSLRNAWQHLHEVMSPVNHSRWRAMTFDIVSRSEAIVPLISSAAEEVAITIQRILADILAISLSESHVESLKNVIQRVISVSHNLRSQRSAYTARLPLPGEVFSPNSMEAVSEELDDLDADYPITCAVFPMVFKSDLGLDNTIIFKARIT